MTTIAANGYFLVADNRSVINLFSDRHYNSDNKQNIKETFTDTNIKINFINSGITIRGSKILAIAGAGNSMYIDVVIKLINNYKVKKYTELKQLVDIFDCFKKEAYMTLVGITANNYSFIIDIDKTVSLYVYSPGKLLVYGSGSSIIDEVIKHGDIDINQVIPVASRFDIDTSASYSAYSSKENHLYAFVRPTEEETFNITKRVIDATFAGYGFSNPTIAHNVI